MRPPITATVITLNEAEKLADCLESLSWIDEIVVLDSGSSDSTVAIAESFGAKVAVRPFDTYSAQKNHAASLAQGDWILNLDADERVSNDLYSAIQTAAFDVDAYDIPRVADFLGKPVRPMNRPLREVLVRLYDRRVCSFKGAAVHEVVTGARRRGELSGELLHEGFRNLHNLIGRFNTYSSLLVAETPRVGHRASRLVMRPLARLCWCLFVKRAVLDGKRGLIASLLWSYHDFQVEAKRYERDVMRPGERSVFADRIYRPSEPVEG
jgi:glycosyltransferase involved in cell wall biosynthesis